MLKPILIVFLNEINRGMFFFRLGCRRAPPLFSRTFIQHGQRTHGRRLLSVAKVTLGLSVPLVCLWGHQNETLGEDSSLRTALLGLKTLHSEALIDKPTSKWPDVSVKDEKEPDAVTVVDSPESRSTLSTPSVLQRIWVYAKKDWVLLGVVCISNFIHSFIHTFTN